MQGQELLVMVLLFHEGASAELIHRGARWVTGPVGAHMPGC
jgi:hypothetical protein